MMNYFKYLSKQKLIDKDATTILVNSNEDNIPENSTILLKFHEETCDADLIILISSLKFLKCFGININEINLFFDGKYLYIDKEIDSTIIHATFNHQLMIRHMISFIPDVSYLCTKLLNDNLK